MIPCPNCGTAILAEKFCPNCGSANPINYVDETVRVSRTRVVGHRKRRRRTHRKVVVAGAGVAIAVLVSAFFASMYTISNMQFRIKEVQDFDFASLSSGLKVEACNPNAFPAGFETISGPALYQNEEFARIRVDGGTIMPYQNGFFDGKIQLGSQTVSGFVLAVKAAVNGTDTPYDDNDITFLLTVESRVIGIIPYSETREFTFADFRQFMSVQNSDTYRC